MVKYNQITDELAEEFQDHYCRLITISYVLNFYRHCVENEIYADNIVELYELGRILRDYIVETKTQFSCLENCLNIPN